MQDGRTSLQDLFVHELQDAYGAEKQLMTALKKMAGAASEKDLAQAFETHLKETEGQVGRLEQAFEKLGLKKSGKECEGVAGIIEEGESLIDEFPEGPVRDAALITAAQRAEHYEIAAYGTLRSFARTLGYDDVGELLQATLEEESATDEKLSRLSERVNSNAGRSASAD